MVSNNHRFKLNLDKVTALNSLPFIGIYADMWNQQLQNGDAEHASDVTEAR